MLFWPTEIAVDGQAWMHLATMQAASSISAPKGLFDAAVESAGAADAPAASHAWSPRPPGGPVDVTSTAPRYHTDGTRKKPHWQHWVAAQIVDVRECRSAGTAIPTPRRR